MSIQKLVRTEAIIGHVKRVGFKNKNGEWDAKQNNQNRSSVKASEDSFQKLWERIVDGRE